MINLFHILLTIIIQIYLKYHYHLQKINGNVESCENIDLENLDL
jgi:hypothetical protein